MPSIELNPPILGLNRSMRLSEQPPQTSLDLMNVRPFDTTTGRIRMGPRAGLSPYLSGYLSGQGNKIQALAGIAYPARHVTYSADPVPNEVWAASTDTSEAVSVLASGLYDDFYTILGNRSLHRFSRYGVSLGSIDLFSVPPAGFIMGAVEVASDGAIYVATSWHDGTITIGIPERAATYIEKYQTQADGRTFEFVWKIGADGFPARMRVIGDVLYAYQTQSPSGFETQLIQYNNINTEDGPGGGDRIILQNIKTSTINGLSSGSLGAGVLFAHDMAVRQSPTGATEWIVCGGQTVGTAVSGWYLLKVKSDGTLTANYLFTNQETNALVANSRGGGVGFACDVNVTGNVYSMGKENTNDDTYLRMLVDTGTAWSESLGWERTTTTDLGGVNPGYGYPRMALDKYANLFVPTAVNSTSVAAVNVVKSDGTLFTSIVHYYPVAGVPTVTSNECRAVALPATYPDYLVDDYKIAEEVFTAGTAVTTGTMTSASTDDPSMHGYDILLETPVSNVSSRGIARVGVASGDIRLFTTSTNDAPTNSTGRVPPLSGSSRLVQSAELFGELFFTDGQDYAVYRPKPTVANPNGEVVNWAANGLGVIPLRCRLIAPWRGRLVLAHSSDSPFAWHMSAFGDPYNWDIAPPEPLATQAVSGATVGAGDSPDIITALIAYSDDLLFMGCDHHIFRLSGDPMAGGELHQVSKEIGMAFGTPWCRDPEGRIYFFGSRGGVYVMGTDGTIQWLTRDTIEADLADTDLLANRVEMVWNSRDNGLHIFIIPYGIGGTHLRHWFWSQKTQGWFPDEFGTVNYTAIQPTACCVIDGDLPDDRVLLIGTEDGRIVQWDPTASDDDGRPIDARLTIWPIAGPEGDLETKFRSPTVILAKELGGCGVKFFASDTPELPEMPLDEYRVEPGMNARLPIRTRGSYCGMQLRSASRVGATVPADSERWAVESIHVEATAGSRKRARAV